MPFCMSCGKQFPDGAKFCPECGTPVISVQPQGQRKQEYAGEIRKCPNCGNNLSAFEAICSACGHELRNTEASVSIQQFADKIARLQAGREPPKAKSSKDDPFGEADAVSKNIANLISSYPIPNSKEDLTEFIVLAASNIDMAYVNGTAPGAKADWASRNLVTEAWRAKFEQAYQKAKMVFGKSPDFRDIQEYHDKKQREMRKAKRSTWKFLIVVPVVLFAVVLGPFLLIDLHFTSEHNREEKRLEAIVAEVQNCIEKEDFDAAFLKANSIYYQNSGYSNRVEEHWDKVREDLIAMIETKSGVSYTSNTSSEESSTSASIGNVLNETVGILGESAEIVKDSIAGAFSGLFK